MPPVKESFFFFQFFAAFDWGCFLLLVFYLTNESTIKKTVILFAHSFYCHITSSCLRVEDTIHTDFSLQMQKSGLQFCKKDSIYVFLAGAKTNRIHLCIFMVKINMENLWHVLHLLYYYADSIPRNFGWGPLFWWKLSQSCSWLLKSGCIFLLLVRAKVLNRSDSKSVDFRNFINFSYHDQVFGFKYYSRRQAFWECPLVFNYFERFVERAGVAKLKTLHIIRHNLRPWWIVRKNTRAHSSGMGCKLEERNSPISIWTI